MTKYSKNHEDLFDFSKLNGNDDLLSIKNKVVIRKIEKKLQKLFWIEIIFCLRSKMYALKCGYDSKIKLESICKTHRKLLNLRQTKKFR